MRSGLTAHLGIHQPTRPRSSTLIIDFGELDLCHRVGFLKEGKGSAHVRASGERNWVEGGDIQCLPD